MVTIGLSRTVSEINGDECRKSHKNSQFSPPPVYLTPPLKGLPLEFGIGVRGPKCLNDGATRWSKKFSDTFSRFDTIPDVTDTQPATQPASHVAVAITLNAKASRLNKAVCIANPRTDRSNTAHYCGRGAVTDLWSKSANRHRLKIS